MSLAWAPLVDLDGLDLVPAFLAEGLRDVPRTTWFLVRVDP
jgi:hypothetical protein